jgi:hypothetical protein
MTTPKKPQNGKREITYQVGWKKGIIQKKAGLAITPLSTEEGLLRYIWRSVPTLPVPLDFYLLCALPVISLIMIITLIYLLNHL